MKQLEIRGLKRLLMIGAHADDIEIGAGGTLLSLLEAHPGMEVSFLVLAAHGERADEARRSAKKLVGRGQVDFRLHSFRERYLHYDPAVKEIFDRLGSEPSPDVVFCPSPDDVHQDHRLVGELVRNTFRDHLILNFEIPKYEGDLGHPNLYRHLTRRQAEDKVAHILESFPSQSSRPWFSAETFLGLMRLRGVESRAPEGYAEGFHSGKAVMG